MKTEGMAHQLVALERMDGHSSYALLMEQGTGKTWTFLADIERAWLLGKIDVVVIFAPRGVHANWILREIPTHMSIPVETYIHRSGATKKEKLHIQNCLNAKQGVLRILAVNYDALLTAAIRQFVLDFVHSALLGSYVVADESHHLKGHNTKRTEYATAIARHCKARRIGTGTAVTNSPGDVFGQFNFLKEGLIGETSYRAFFTQYAQVCNAQNPTLQSDFAFKAEILKNPRRAFALIVAKDDITGKPIYKNLDKLGAILEKHSYRVLKKNCLDLPPKLYTNRYFDLDDKQRAAYELMERDYRIKMEDDSLKPVQRLAALVKLQQITSGYIVVPGRDEPMYVAEKNPRLEMLLECLEDIEGQFIIWAKFRPELAAIAGALEKAGIIFVEYHGGIKEKDREAAVDKFMRGEARGFIANASAGGTGLTLTCAQTAIYYSNSFNAGHRQQSEDRNHRKGSVGEHILYIDISCQGTIDTSIAEALQYKKDVAKQILDDRGIDARGLVFGDND